MKRFRRGDRVTHVKWGDGHVERDLSSSRLRARFNGQLRRVYKCHIREYTPNAEDNWKQESTFDELLEQAVERAKDFYRKIAKMKRNFTYRQSVHNEHLSKHSLGKSDNPTKPEDSNDYVAEDTLDESATDEQFESRPTRSKPRKPGGNECKRREQRFSWPTTDAPIGHGSMGKSSFKIMKGIFKHFNYAVGKDGRPEQERRKILDDVFACELPTTFNQEYLSEFGAPKTSLRLRKMANFIAAQTRNYKRKQEKTGADYSVAIADSTADLNYLHVTYYVGYFGFDRQRTTESPNIDPVSGPDPSDNQDAPPSANAIKVKRGVIVTVLLVAMLFLAMTVAKFLV